jgi:putative phosphoesterase
MRILVLADIHANWPALQALKQTFDVCLVVGDLVDYALEPAPCIDWVRRNASYAVRGNHDHAVAQNVVINGRNGLKYLSGVSRILTRERLGAEDLRYLGALPVTSFVTLENTKYLLVHATPRDPLDEYARPDKELWSRLLQEVDVDVVCVGHTHFQYALEVGNKLVINPGSVGQPRDGDPRGAYAVIDNNRVELKRFEYPIEETVRVVEESSLPDDAKEMLGQIYRNGRSVLRSDSLAGSNGSRNGSVPQGDGKPSTSAQKQE